MRFSQRQRECGWSGIVDSAGWICNVEKTAERRKKQSISISIPNPKFWWPNGYGEQESVSGLTVKLRIGDTTISKNRMNCGFRDFRIAREKDRWGRVSVLQ